MPRCLRSMDGGDSVKTRTVGDRVLEADDGHLEGVRRLLQQGPVHAAVTGVQPDLRALAGEARADVRQRVLLLRVRILEEKSLGFQRLQRVRLQAGVHLELDVHADAQRLHRPLERDQVRIGVGEDVDPPDAPLRPLRALGGEQDRRPELREAVALERVHRDVDEVVGRRTPAAALDRLDLRRQPAVLVGKSATMFSSVAADAGFDPPFLLESRGIASSWSRPIGRGGRPPP